jgi:hypothetical protein
MATRSAIGIKHGDRIKAVYCHWDGYVEHVGVVLDTYYQSSTTVNKLIAMGDISGIGADIGEKHDFGARAEYLPDGVATQCTFYTRDRGEDASFKSFGSEADFVDHYEGCGSEYFYLYDHGVWYVKAYRGEFKPLHEEVERVISKETA